MKVCVSSCVKTRPNWKRLIPKLSRLRQALKEAKQAGHQQNPKLKKRDKPKRPGRKPGKGLSPVVHRPQTRPRPPPLAVPVTVVRCPCCGALKFERVDEVSNTDIPSQPEPEIRVASM